MMQTPSPTSHAGAAPPRPAHDAMLVACDPGSLRAMRRGAVLVVVGLALVLLASIARGIARAAPGSGFVGVTWYAPTLCWTVVLAGWWLLSTRTTPDGVADRLGGARIALRTGLLVYLVFMPIALLFTARVRAGGSQLFAIGALSTTLAAIGSIVVHYFSSLVYLRGVARRAQDGRLSERATMLMWFGPLGYAFMLAGALGSVVVSLASLLLLVGVVIVFVKWGMYIGLVHRTGALAAEALEEARALAVATEPSGPRPF